MNKCYTYEECQYRGQVGHGRGHFLGKYDCCELVLRTRIIFIRIRIQDLKKFVKDPDPGNNCTNPDPYKKGFSTRKIFKILFKKRVFLTLCVFYIILDYPFSSAVYDEYGIYKTNL